MRNGYRAEKPWLDDDERVIEPDEFTDLLDTVYSQGPDGEESRRALARVEGSLKEYGSGRLYYDVLSATPFGPIYIAMSDKGVAALGFDDSEQDFLTRMGRRYRTPVERSRTHVAQVTEQLKDYFAGKRDSFDVPLDLRSITPFQRVVLDAIQQIPSGETISYGGLARRIGKPGAARAVGRALGSNPIPIIIPCHRALAADGSLGGYSGRGGVRTKQALLSLEGAWG
jgi:methylated-DNA-[protein]-cysteine S-methyltransferase